MLKYTHARMCLDFKNIKMMYMHGVICISSCLKIEILQFLSKMLITILNISNNSLVI